MHDELVFDAVQEEVTYITPKTKELMTPALLLRPRRGILSGPSRHGT